MGMYASIRGTEIKLSGLTAEAVCQAKGVKRLDDSCMELSRDDVTQILTRINATFSAGMPLVEDGSISAHTCYSIAALAEFAALLVDWLCNTDENSIVFG